MAGLGFWHGWVWGGNALYIHDSGRLWRKYDGSIDCSKGTLVTFTHTFTNEPHKTSPLANVTTVEALVDCPLPSQPHGHRRRRFLVDRCRGAGW